MAKLEIYSTMRYCDGLLGDATKPGAPPSADGLECFQSSVRRILSRVDRDRAGLNNSLLSPVLEQRSSPPAEGSVLTSHAICSVNGPAHTYAKIGKRATQEVF